jgi:hypothetical protein
VSVYRKIHIKMYSDAKFCALSPPKPSGQYLWIYLMTGPHTCAVPGLSVAGEYGLAEKLKWPIAAFRRCFAEIADLGMAKADWRAGVIWLPKGLAYNPPENPNIITGWRTHWALVPECPLKTEAALAIASQLSARPTLASAFREWCLEPSAKPLRERFPKPSRHGSANQEQEQEQETPLSPPTGGAGRAARHPETAKRPRRPRTTLEKIQASAEAQGIS